MRTEEADQRSKLGSEPFLSISSASAVIVVSLVAGSILFFGLNDDSEPVEKARSSASKDKKQGQSISSTVIETNKSSGSQQLIDSAPLVTSGLAVQTANHYKTAETALTRALELKPGSSKLYRRRGLVLKDQGQWDSALRDFDRAIKLDPKDPANFIARAELISELPRDSQAMKDLEVAIKLDPSNPESFILKARVLLKSQKTAEAGRAISEAMKLSGGSAKCYALKASYELRVGNDDQAKRDMSKALELDHNSAFVNYYASSFALKNKRTDQAIEYCTKAIKLCPSMWQAYFHRGSIYSSMFDKEELALADYAKATSLNPKNADMHFAHFFLLTRLERNEEAVKELSKAIALKGTPQFYQYRAETNLKLGRSAEALADCNSSIKAGTREPRPYLYKGLALTGLQRNEEAEAAFTKALAINPGYETAYVNRGRLYLKQGRYEKAVADFSACLKRRPHEVRALQGRAEAYEKLGRFDLAKRDRSGAGKDFGDLLGGIQDATTNMRDFVDKSEGVDKARKSITDAKD